MATVAESIETRRVRICLPAFQDFHRLMPRVASRAHVRRLATKLAHWEPGATAVLDHQCVPIDDTGLFNFLVDEIGPSVLALRLTFFEFLGNEPHHELWVIATSGCDQPLSEDHLRILHGRRTVAQTRAAPWDFETV